VTSVRTRATICLTALSVRIVPDVAIEPDSKDWTWVLQRECPECGLTAADVGSNEIPERVRSAAAAMAQRLAAVDATERPDASTWSPLEYACHVRDVCRVFDDRLALMLDRDDPEFANWDQDETAVSERYAEQDPAVVTGELAVDAEALATRFGRVADDQWPRTGRRSNGSVFTVETLGQYLVHDLVHHVHDVSGPRR
jgi:hypothetical protein